jgi:hypothetical protein
MTHSRIEMFVILFFQSAHIVNLFARKVYIWLARNIHSQKNEWKRTKHLQFFQCPNFHNLLRTISCFYFENFRFLFVVGTVGFFKHAGGHEIFSVFTFYL